MLNCSSRTLLSSGRIFALLSWSLLYSRLLVCVAYSREMRNGVLTVASKRSRPRNLKQRARVMNLQMRQNFFGGRKGRTLFLQLLG